MTPSFYLAYRSVQLKEIRGHIRASDNPRLRVMANSKRTRFRVSFFFVIHKLYIDLEDWIGLYYSRYFNQMNQLPQLLEQNKIGRGTFGVVYKTQYNGVQCAVKKISLIEIRRHQMTKKLIREINIMKKLDHQNIVGCLGAVEDEKSFSQLLILELCDCNLREFMKANSQQFYSNMKLKIKIALQFLNALWYLKKQRIANRDIKLQNIMVKKEGNNPEQIKIKLTDFGESREYILATQTVQQIGTYLYMSPQVYFSNKYDEKCDIWSSGVALFQIFQGFDHIVSSQDIFWPFIGALPQFQTKSDQLKFYHQFYQEFIDEPMLLSQEVPPTFRKIIRGMLKPDPKQRITLQIIHQLCNQNQNQILSLFSQKQKQEYQNYFMNWGTYQQQLASRQGAEELLRNGVEHVFRNVLQPLNKELKKLRNSLKIGPEEFIKTNKIRETIIFFCQAYKKFEFKMEELTNIYNWKTEDFEALLLDDYNQIQDITKAFNSYDIALSNLNISFSEKPLNIETIKVFIKQYCPIQRKKIDWTIKQQFPELCGISQLQSSGFKSVYQNL